MLLSQLHNASAKSLATAITSLIFVATVFTEVIFVATVLILVALETAELILDELEFTALLEMFEFTVVKAVLLQ